MKKEAVAILGSLKYHLQQHFFFILMAYRAASPT